jgi:hypothetical protein
MASRHALGDGGCPSRVRTCKPQIEQMFYGSLPKADSDLHINKYTP